MMCRPSTDLASQASLTADGLYCTAAELAGPGRRADKRGVSVSHGNGGKNAAAFLSRSDLHLVEA